MTNAKQVFCEIIYFLENNAYLLISKYMYIDKRAICLNLFPQVVIFMHRTFLRLLDCIKYTCRSSLLIVQEITTNLAISSVVLYVCSVSVVDPYFEIIA